MKGNMVLEMLKGLVTKVQSLSRTQAIIAATAAVVAVGGAGTGGYFLYENSHQPQETIADLDMDTEETEASEAMTEEELIVAEVVMVTEETEAAEPEIKELSLICTSMEKDLKIKIQDQNSKLVTGVPFVVTVAEDKSGAKTTDYEDKDQDGIIYIKDIKAGSYKVVLEELDGYTIKKGAITVTVKDKLEYEKVDVTGEIKTEKEVNTSVEDTAVNNVPVESVVTDTVPLLDSSVTTTKVDKAQVDTSNFTKASAGSEKITETFTRQTTVVIPQPEPDTSGSESVPQPSESESQAQPPKTEPGEDEAIEGDEAVEQNPSELEGAIVQRNRTSRVATAPSGDSVTISLPKEITMYNGGNPQSTTYTITPAISGSESVIKSIEWLGCTNPAFKVVQNGYSATITYTESDYKGGDIVVRVIYWSSENKESEWSTSISIQTKDMTDGTTLLKDKNGNILYTDEKAQKQATLKDYASATVFYTAPQYTGWQTMDGKVYYYDANHKAVTGNQVIGGVTYTFNSDGSLAQSSGSRGIDVSKWQGKIDWGAVAASGINFAIIRVGYRGASTGALIEDPYFKQNIAGATRAGIKVGVYFFTQAVTEAEAVEEASMVLTLIAGYKVSYPVFIDTESASNGRANGLNRNARTAIIRAFCQTIASGGYKPGVYASKSWYNNQLNASALNGYCIWVAQYNSSCTYSGKYDIWQHTSKGRVPGINGDVDLNIGYTSY